MARSRVYRHGVVEHEDIDLASISEHLSHDDCVVWVDLVGDEVDSCLAVLSNELGLHELAVEDALDPHHRPQLGHFIDHLLLTCPTARVDVTTGELLVRPMTAFIGDRWLITVHLAGEEVVDQVLARWDASPELARHGVSYLVYGLLDVVVDSYFDTVSAFDDFYDEISDAIFAERPIDPSEQAHSAGGPVHRSRGIGAQAADDAAVAGGRCLGGVVREGFDSEMVIDRHMSKAHQWRIHGAVSSGAGAVAPAEVAGPDRTRPGKQAAPRRPGMGFLGRIRTGVLSILA